MRECLSASGTLSSSTDGFAECPFMGVAVPMVVAVGAKMIAPWPTRVETRRRLDTQRGRRRDHHPQRRVRRCGPTLRTRRAYPSSYLTHPAGVPVWVIPTLGGHPHMVGGLRAILGHSPPQLT